MKKICCIFNYGSHYRSSLYQMIDTNFDCHFYIGDKISGDIKSMDYTTLKGLKKVLMNKKLIGNFYWQKGALSVHLNSYSFIIATGDPYCLSTWFVLIFSKISNRKVFLWSHGWYGRETNIKRIFKKIFFKLAYRILLYGEYSKELMKAEGFSDRKLVCFYNSLDYNTHIAIRNKIRPNTSIYFNHFKNTFLNLIFVGRLTKIKKIDLLLNALSILKLRGIDFNLTIIGDGDDLLFLQKKVNELNLSNDVWFYGKCYDENILSELIYNADLCVSPGNVGLTSIHSMSFGTPVISHDNFTLQMPEFEAIEDGVTGSFFIYDDTVSLANSIQSWFAKDLDRNIVRNSCYKVIDEKYNPIKQLSILKELIN